MRCNCGDWEERDVEASCFAASDVQSVRHARVEEVPAEALLDPDPDLRLAWAPLWDDAPGCQYGACANDEVCDCQAAEDD